MDRKIFTIFVGIIIILLMLPNNNFAAVDSEKSLKGRYESVKGRYDNKENLTVEEVQMLKDDMQALEYDMIETKEFWKDYPEKKEFIAWIDESMQGLQTEWYEIDLVEKDKKSDSSKTNGTGESNKKLMKKNVKQIRKWLNKNSAKNLSKEVKKDWEAKIAKAKESEKKDEKKDAIAAEVLMNGGTKAEADKAAIESTQSIYTLPGKEDNEESGVSGENVDDIISKSENFINGADKSVLSSEEDLQGFSGLFYNILLTIGVACVVITGMIIGIKYMIGSVEEKANYKQMLVPYLIGSLAVLGAFGIWKLILDVVEKL